MKYNITFPRLGVRITPDTTDAEVSRLAAKYPEVKKAIEKQTQHGKTKETGGNAK
jgi:hypothetical protein